MTASAVVRDAARGLVGGRRAREAPFQKAGAGRRVLVGNGRAPLVGPAVEPQPWRPPSWARRSIWRDWRPPSWTRLRTCLNSPLPASSSRIEPIIQIPHDRVSEKRIQVILSIRPQRGAARGRHPHPRQGGMALPGDLPRPLLAQDCRPACVGPHRRRSRHRRPGERRCQGRSAQGFDGACEPREPAHVG